MSLPRDILLFSTADWDHAFWTNKQHQACELARRGYRILYVESLGLRRPAVRGRDIRRMAARLVKGLRGVRPAAPNIWVLSPLVVPLHGRPWLRRLNDFLLTRAVAWAARSLEFEAPILWTYQPLVERLLGRLPHSRVVYHCVDDLSAAPGMAGGVLAEAEQRLLCKADVVFATSRALAGACARTARSVHYLPNVADYEHFAQAGRPGLIPEELARIPAPRIGFVGAVSDYKLDFGLVADLARRRPAWHWVLIGQVGEGQPWVSADGLRLPNVHLLGPRPYAVLPNYLRGFDVAVIPSPRNRYTASMFPMKFFEYLAAGKPVVALNVPALDEFRDACRLTDSPEAFLQAVEQVLSGRLPDPERARTLARRYTWSWRTDLMLDVLAGADPSLARAA